MNDLHRSPKVAIASSGLGHVARGIETWAVDTAAALAARGVDVTLFAAMGFDASRFTFRVSRLPCLRRFDHATQWITRLTPGFMWRWGLKQAYGWEEFTFWLRLWPRLQKGGFDILHVQDAWLAFWCRKFRKLGLVRTKEILGHGTEESPEWLAQFEYVQHLAPYHLEKAKDEVRGARCEGRHRYWTAVPNFVDTGLFRPVRERGEREQCRKELGIPIDAFVIGTAATVKRPHKRIDYLIREFAVLPTHPHTHTPTHFLIAGARTPETDSLLAMADELAPGRVTFCLDLPRERMPGFYRALDVFVLVSLFEMMPIAVLEALASGVPVIAHAIPQLQWMVGDVGRESIPVPACGEDERKKLHRELCRELDRPKLDRELCRELDRSRSRQSTRCSFELADGSRESGGATIDMSREGALATFLAEITPDWIEEKGCGARQRALAMFATEVVIGEYVKYYRRVMRAEG